MARGMCVYCGIEDDLTDDHIPPRCLFPAGQRDDLLVIPSCPKCNTGASKDDEYFRNMLAVNEHSRAGEVLENAQGALARSLTRPEADGLRAAFLGSLHEVELITPTGLYVETRTAFRLEPERMKRVLQRIGRALFFKETGRMLPPDARVDASASWGFPGIPDNASVGFAEAAAMLPALRTLAGGAFKYGGMVGDGNSCASGWLVEFYRGVGFVIRTGPPEANSE